MTNRSDKAPDNSKVLESTRKPDKTDAEARAWFRVNAETSAAFVIDAHQFGISGIDANVMELFKVLRESSAQSKAGDLSHLEAMLISQATALQAIFTSFAKRAAHQQYQQHLQAYMGMALKAQAQRRAHPPYRHWWT